MRVLIDIVHPGHVHFYRHLVRELAERGHAVTIAARDKDVTCPLLDSFGMQYARQGRGGVKGRLAMGAELVRRVAALRRIGFEFRADVVLTRNPAGVQAARLLRVPGVFDTDDGAAAGVHWKGAVPFARYITMPDCVLDDHRNRRVPYPSYKAMAYLHPKRFTPDPGVRNELGVAPDERYFIVRFVAMAASHDRHEKGMPLDVKGEVIARLSKRGKVFVTSESGFEAPPGATRFPLPPQRIHDAMAFASLLVGDSQSMAAESAILGVPSVRLSSWAGRIPYLVEIEERYGLTFEFGLDRPAEFLQKVEDLSGTDERPFWAERREHLLSEKCDLTSWYLDFVLGLPERTSR